MGDPAADRQPAPLPTKKNALAGLGKLRNYVSETEERDAAVRAALDEVLPSVPSSLKEACVGIEHTGRSLRQLLGPGSEAILPADDRMMPPQRLAAALLTWARKRLCRSQTRKWLVKTASGMSGLTRKLAQKMASRPPAPYPSQAVQRLIIYQGTTKVRYRIRSLTWADGPSQPRIFETIFEPRSIFEGPSLSASVTDLLLRRKKKKPPGPNIMALAPKVTPSPLKALRGGMRNSSEGCTGIHLREMGVRSLEHAASIRGKIRTVILAMGASNDVNGNEGAEEEPLGASDVLDGIRWKRCREVGAPLQEAWALAVCERLFSFWTRIGLGANGEVTPYPSAEAMRRQGVPNLPGCWCPARPRSAARAPSRKWLRAFLNLLLEQKRIHVDELNRGYDFVASQNGLAAAGGDEPLLTKHAKCCLKGLHYEKRANARWEILLEKQLAPEPEEECDAAAVASDIRRASVKLEALEKLLIEGLAEYSDVRGALRVHIFNKDADVPLKTQLANRLVGTAFGELLGQRFEQLESPEFAPRLLGAASVIANETTDLDGDGDDDVVVDTDPSDDVHLIPAADAAEELAVDNKYLALFIGCLPAMLRHATGSSGGSPVGDPDAYDAVLREMLLSIMENPSTLVMLTFGCTARYAWAAMRKGPGAPPSKDAPPADGTKKKPPELGTKELANVHKVLGPLISRVRAATPKGGKPTDGGTISALKEETGQLEADAQLLKDPTDLDIEEIRGCLTATCNLVAAAMYAIRMKDKAAADPPEDAEAAEAAAAKIKARNASSVKKIKDYVSEALSMSLDVFMVSPLDAATLLSVIGEAVGDVSIEQTDLIRSMYKLLYMRTLDAVMTSPKIPVQAPRKFLAKLVKRKPCVPVSPDEAVAWCVGTALGEIKGEAAKAQAWAKAVVSALDASREAQRVLLEWLTFLTLDELRAVQGVLSVPPAGQSPLLLSELVSTGVGGVARQTLLSKLDLAMVPDSDDPLRLNKAFRLLAGREPQGGASAAAYGLPLRYAEGEARLERAPRARAGVHPLTCTARALRVQVRGGRGAPARAGDELGRAQRGGAHAARRRAAAAARRHRVQRAAAAPDLQHAVRRGRQGGRAHDRAHARRVCGARARPRPTTRCPQIPTALGALVPAPSQCALHR